MVGAALFGGAAILAWLVAGDPISQTKWNQIHAGMSKEQVIKAMGAPRSDYGVEIVYSRPLNVGWVAFSFDTNGILILKNDESVFGSLK